MCAAHMILSYLWMLFTRLFTWENSSHDLDDQNSAVKYKSTPNTKSRRSTQGSYLLGKREVKSSYNCNKKQSDRMRLIEEF